MYYSEAKKKAKEKLSKSWNKSIIVGYIYSCTVLFINKMDISSIYTIDCTYILLSLLIAPIVYGVFKYFTGYIKDEKTSIKDIFMSYKDFSKIVVAKFIQTLLIRLWMLIFIIPGVIKACSYTMMYNIMNDNPEMSGLEACKLSEKMMKGHKRDFALLVVTTVGLVFVPWFGAIAFSFLLELYQIAGLGLPLLKILASLVKSSGSATYIIFIVIGIWGIWLFPYYLVAKSYFYEKIKKEYTESREV